MQDDFGSAPKRVGRYPKVFHHHLRKCGGTSVNWWLSQYAGAARTLDDSVQASVSRAWWGGEAGLQDAIANFEGLGRRAFAGADLFGAHLPLERTAPPGTFVFTVLREPRRRLVSQVADFRRLGEHDLAGILPAHACVIRDARVSALKNHLESHGRAFLAYDNYITRQLASSVLGLEAVREKESAVLFAAARQALQSHFAFIGIAEYPLATLNRLADLLGFAPEQHPPQLNPATSSALLEEMAPAAQILDELTHHDRQLYDFALEQFEAQHRAPGEAYGRAQFERDHAGSATAALTPQRRGGDRVFSVRDPLIGSGFHGRDGRGTAICRVWSGPSPASLLYMPVPENARLTVKLWLHGYAHPRQREALKLRIDGHLVPHRFQPEAGCAELLLADVQTSRSFVALEIDIGAAASDAQMPQGDARHRGFSFGAYGWCQSG